MKLRLICSIAALGLAVAAHAVPVQYSFMLTPNAEIPGPPGSAFFELVTPVPFTSILDLDVRIVTQDGYNPDLSASLIYGSLSDSPYADLLGHYDDDGNFSGIAGATSGMDVWLDDQAVVNIQDAGGSGFLTGIFKPSANLDIFNGLNPNSDNWSFIIYSNSSGPLSTLSEVTLRITGDVPDASVPDAGGGVVFSGIIFGSLLCAGSRLRCAHSQL